MDLDIRIRLIFGDAHCTISDTIVSFELFFLGGSINEKQTDLENLNL